MHSFPDIKIYLTYKLQLSIMSSENILKNFRISSAKDTYYEQFYKTIKWGIISN